MVNRGEIWWVDMPEHTGSHPGYARPVVIVQSNVFNRSRIKTTLAVVVSSNMRLVDAPGNVRLTPKKTGLSKDSVANVSQIITLDKTMLREKTGELSQRSMHLIDEGMRLVLAV